MVESEGGRTESDRDGGADFDPDEDPDLHIVTERECNQCGDLVLTLSSRDWCDACELDEPE